MALNFNKQSNEGNAFLKQLSIELECPGDLHKTGRMLRTVLHVMRDMLIVNESLQLLAQLPMFLKAVYVENWKLIPPNKKVHNYKDFMNALIDTNIRSEDDFKTDAEIEFAVKKVINALMNYVSEGEMEDVRAEVPKDLKGFFQKHFYIEKPTKRTMI
jgi:uncharacterized protein (DUF2267 family)